MKGDGGCDYCWGTGFYRGHGAPCPHGPPASPDKRQISYVPEEMFGNHPPTPATHPFTQDWPVGTAKTSGKAGDAIEIDWRVQIVRVDLYPPHPAVAQVQVFYRGKSLGTHRLLDGRSFVLRSMVLAVDFYGFVCHANLYGLSGQLLASDVS